MNINDLLLQKALGQLPRVLGFIDRDASLSTYGCADRTWWHYRTVDFVNARYQEAARLLALAHEISVDQNRFFKAPVIKSWALAVCEFWAKIRHEDGSVDESYTNERHFCATAFSLFSVIETYLLLKEKPDFELISSALFISQHDNLDVCNQTACAAAALYGLTQLSNENQWRQKADIKIESLLKRQSSQGNFSEYGGFDLGYDTVTLSLLAKIYQYSAREDIYQAALRLAGAIDTYLDQDGYFNPQSMSRRTSFIYPYGFAFFKPEVLNKIEQGLNKDVIINPSWMDDRYCIPLACDYLMTILLRMKSCNLGN